MARVLLLDKDETSFALIKEALTLPEQTDDGAAFQSEDTHSFIIPPPIDPEEVPKGKTIEPLDHVFKALNEKPFDFIFMDVADIKEAPRKWLESFRKRITLEQNKDIRIVLFSHSDDIDLIRRFVIEGLFADFILKPLERTLFRQRFGLLCSKNASYKKELYSIATAQPVNVAYSFIIEEVSEFGLILKANREYAPGEFVTFYSPVFKTDKKAEVIAKCYKSEKTQGSNEYLSHFVFVSAGDNIRKQIRSWMKLEYVRKKQAS